MIRIKLDVTKIDKSAIFHGAKGKYLDLTLMDNREGRDQYGNDGFIAQDIGKDRRLAGEKGPILGNWKHLDAQPAGRDVSAAEATGRKAVTNETKEEDECDDIPF